MKAFRLLLILVAVSSVLVGSVHMTAHRAAASTSGPGNLSAATRKELARTRAATAKYHDVAQAEADGYINVDICDPGEGCHWVKPSLIDGNFEAEKPEVLLYASGPGNSGLRLVAVEYIVPLGLSPDGPPEGFTGSADLWREDSEEGGFWELTAWIWLRNPNGLFEQHNPRVP